MISLDALFDIAKSQPILTGGIGTVMFGSAMYLVRGIPIWIHSSAKRMLTIEASLTSDSFLYHELLGVLSSGRISAFARNYTTDYDGNIVAGYGRSIAFVENRLVTFYREIIKDKLSMSEKLSITIFTRNVDVLRRMVTQAKRPKADEKVKVYTASAGHWHHPIRKRKRGLDTVFLNDDIKRDVVGRIEWFRANEKWYVDRGIPYKLVVMLHGEPGTGKSSFIYGLASHFDSGLGAFNNLSGVDSALRNLPENTFAVVEDIDMLTVSRDDVDEDDMPAPVVPKGFESSYQRSALQVLINTLDGLTTPHGLILFITTNFRERLDAALIRPGRVDCDIEIGRLDRETTEQMYVAFYGEKNRGLIREYIDTKDFVPRTGAQLQLLFMTENAKDAIRALGQGIEGRDRRQVGDIPLVAG